MTRDRLKVAEYYLDPSETLLSRWLITRTNGKLRKTYGKGALISATNAYYRCEFCGFPDVRTLHIDHVHGHIESTEFVCLCANCHNIKSREQDWGGMKKY